MVSRTTSIAALAYAYLYLEDTAGNGRLLSLGVVNTQGGAWGKLQQSFQVPAGTYRRMELMVLSTRADQSLYLDNVTLNRLCPHARSLLGAGLFYVSLIATLHPSRAAFRLTSSHGKRARCAVARQGMVGRGSAPSGGRAESSWKG